MREYAFASGAHNAYHWNNHDALSWEGFLEWLALDDPANRKACGGYVAGELQETTGHPKKPDCVGLHRRADAIVKRSVAVLDADAASATFFLDISMELAGTALAMYTTWSHTPENPRWRLLIPLSEDVKPRDYRLIVKALMHDLGPEQFDKGSSEPERVMFRPSTQGSYHAHVVDGEPLDVDVWLARAEELKLADEDQPKTEFHSTYDELTEDQQREADAYVERIITHWRELYADAVTWAEDERDDKFRGWEALSRDGAWALARLAACPWTNIDETGAELMYHEVLPAEMAENADCGGKWYDGIVERAAEKGADAPPWEGRTSAEDDFEAVKQANGKLPPCDHTNEAHVSRWLIGQLGTGPLSGLFRRGDDDLIYTPRVGEDGYEPPENPADHDGPAQVRRMTPLRLASRVDASYHVFRWAAKKTKTSKAEQVDMVFRRDLAERVMADLDRCSSLQRVSMVSHTPLARADGSVLDTPGYDAPSRVLYLPESGLDMDPVPDVPSDAELEGARDLLLDMLVDFPFVTEHDQANYLGCLMLPLLRNVVPPPYQMLIIGAPQRGSGKSLLAYIMRAVHGGVFRSEIPREEDERRKVITSILDGTSAPIVQFDNVTGALKSSTMDGLLTNAVWSDRRLGGNENVIVPNDRLWVVTGNNVHIGGDMDRRVLWSTINANLEHPELRPPTQFVHSDLEGWVRDNRASIIRAMLVVIRAWAVSGMPVQEAPTSDSFGRMQQVLRGVMANASMPGELGHTDSKPDRPDLEAEEWSGFLRAVHRVMGEQAWTTRQLLDTLDGADFDEDGAGLRPDELPGDLADRVRVNPHGVAKSLGKMLSARQSQWSSGLKVEQSEVKSGKHAVKWVVTDRV